MMIAWWAGAVAPRLRLAARNAASYAGCVAIEASQLYRAPGIDAVRATWLGHSVLGSGFDMRDLGAYALGVVGAAVLTRVLGLDPNV